MNQRLIRLRKRMKLNQRELAKLSGVPFWRIAYAESNYRKLERDQLAAIKRVLETPRVLEPSKPTPKPGPAKEAPRKKTKAA